MTDLAALKARRGQSKSKQTRFNTIYVSDLSKESLNPFEIKCRIKKIEEIWSEFDQVQSVIELVGEKNENYRIEFEETYFSAVALGESLLDSVGMKNVDPTENNSTTKVPTSHALNCSLTSCCNATAPIQLSAIDVPKFSGAYEEWSEFYDIYTAMIHNNP